MSNEKPADEKPAAPRALHPCPVCGKEMEHRCGDPRGCGWTCECGYDSLVADELWRDAVEVFSRMTPEERRKMAEGIVDGFRGGSR